MKRLVRLTVIVLGLTALAPVPPRAPEAQGVTVFHKGRPITVALAAVPWHLLHGDGLCDPNVPPGCS